MKYCIFRDNRIYDVIFRNNIMAPVKHFLGKKIVQISREKFHDPRKMYIGKKKSQIPGEKFRDPPKMSIGKNECGKYIENIS